MRKRTILFTLALAALMLLAWAPASVSGQQHAGIRQATAPAPGPTIEVTVVVGPTGAPVTVVSPATLPLSTTVIIVLLIIIGIGIIVGGMALMSRRQALPES